MQQTTPNVPKNRGGFRFLRLQQIMGRERQFSTGQKLTH